MASGRKGHRLGSCPRSPLLTKGSVSFPLTGNKSLSTQQKLHFDSVISLREPHPHLPLTLGVCQNLGTLLGLQGRDEGKIKKNIRKPWQVIVSFFFSKQHLCRRQDWGWSYWGWRHLNMSEKISDIPLWGIRSQTQVSHCQEKLQSENWA